ncbi:MAG: hypothetical protein ABFD96_15575 [Armatimonadia bacterium]
MKLDPPAIAASPRVTTGINGGTIDGTTLGSTCIYVVPSVDPEVAGALWNNNITLAVSAGA